MSSTSFTYVKAPATRAMRAAPRFSRPRDFSLLFSDDKSEVTDYAVGLIFGSCMILALFLTWAFILLLFKFLGQKKVGFLSGAPFKQHPEKTNVRWPCFHVRVIFLSAALVFITFSILLVTNGITNLRDTITTVINANSEVQQIESDAGSIVEALNSLAVPTSDMREALIKLTTGVFCPDSATLEEETGIKFDNLSNGTKTILVKIGDFLQRDYLRDFDEALAETNRTTQEIDNQTENIDLNDWQALVFIVPYVVIPSFLLVALMMVWFGVEFPTYTCIVRWFFLPLFVLVTSIAFVLSAVVLMGAVANADFCSGEDAGFTVSPSPDDTILSILKRSGVKKDDLEFQIVLFYVGQCVSDDPFGFITQYESEIKMANEQLGSFADALESVTIEKLSLLCGRDFTSFDSLLSSMGTNLDILRSNARAVMELLRCSRIVPIYTSTVYDGTCTYSITGVTWLFSSSLIVGFMGMLMIMLRSAMWAETAYDDDNYDKGELAPYEEEELDDDIKNIIRQPFNVADLKEEQAGPREVSESVTKSGRSNGSHGYSSDGDSESA